MKKISLRFLSAFFGLAALAAGTRAQAIDKLVVNIPYEFVAAGATLPAGTYTINRINNFNTEELAISSYENRHGVLLIPSVVSGTSEFKPKLSFEVIGDQHFLTKIETADHIFTFPVSKKSAPVVAKNQGAPATAGTSGSN